jgi:hypothetical protein
VNRIEHVVELRRTGWLAVVYLDKHRVSKRQFATLEAAQAWAEEVKEELRQEVRM